MLYVVHGNDVSKTGPKLGALLDGLREKKPDASVIRPQKDEISPEFLDECTAGQGLFERKLIIVLEEVLSDEAVLAAFLDRLSDVSESENVFLLKESVLGAEAASILKKAAKVWECSLEKKGREMPSFALSDALGARDRKTLWVLYQKALMKGSAPEELHGTLFWQVKTMWLASHSKNANDAGLKPFVYSKSQSFARKYSEEEMKGLLTDLLTLYHRARRGQADFETELERFVLGV